MAAHNHRPPTREEIARNGHVAIAIRDYLARSGKSMAELNAMIGRAAGNASLYGWRAGKSCPTGDGRTRLAKVLGITEAELKPRLGDGRELVRADNAVPAVTGATPVPRLEARLAIDPWCPVGATPVPARLPEVLSFVVDDAGMARLRLDATMPLERATPLLRMLLDAGLVFSAPEVEP